MATQLRIQPISLDELRERLAECACEHDDVIEHYVTGDLSDIRTVRGICRGCGEWVVQTQYASRRGVDTRMMTKREREAICS